MRTGLAREAFLPATGCTPVDWSITDGLTAYEEAVTWMERRVEAIAENRAAECVWLVEHPALYTAGTSANAKDLGPSPRFPVHKSGRGGQYTYHGPGQRIAYVMLDLKRRRPDVRAFVAALEHWIIAALAEFNVAGRRHEDRVGVWVERPDKPQGVDGAAAEDKIAAIGIRLRRWVSFHGISINVDPDLSNYDGIIPCGVAQAHLGVTSLFDLGQLADMPAVDSALRSTFETTFGMTRKA